MNTRIAGKTVLTIILAGGKGSRLAPMTDQVAKPAVPFMGTYRLIDFSLSNIVHSGLQDVWIIEQYLPHSLNEHLAGGRPWDLDRTRGGLKVMPPFSGPADEDGGFSEGNAHALALHTDLIRESGADIVLVLSADHIYKLDYAPVIQQHLDKEASVTVVTTDISDKSEATRFSNVCSGKDGKITEFAYKPDEPLGRTVACEVFVYDAVLLTETLDDLQAEGNMGDYGEHLLPRLVERGDAYTYPLEGYWLDVGTLSAYHQAHRDFLEGGGLELDCEEWPFITSSITRPPTRIRPEATINDSFVCGGADIAGTVIRSLIGPGAVVEKGAEVRDTIVQAGGVIRAGAKVSRAIVDREGVVGDGATVGSLAPNARLCVVGAQARVDGGAELRPGQQVAPGARLRQGQTGQDLEGEH
ncbi:glucose-1-phosphate adenylyltransferase family protein [Deinococcus radiophilus]|uniref:glucose-1-phosphate adenylyltransferase family protein n=1 Tax=Deinococcus radiophilus TaxID=32062 RepID=UPI001E4A0DF8|nr:sugar phosphate nucleotidyltransferase [Deinococcus radiophilus]UFA50015.1 NTP transferase domain-containing protein [Deinococcus radiophilus]